jgi:hypothetical protein
MKKYALKEITLEMVLNDYNDSIMKSCQISDKELTDPKLKEITDTHFELLTLLGVSGLEFLSKTMKGENNYKDAISDEDIYEAYSLCDGFGLKTKKQLKKINDGWDWSHVRDSSPDAILEAEYYLKLCLIDFYNKYVL